MSLSRHVARAALTLSGALAVLVVPGFANAANYCVGYDVCAGTPKMSLDAAITDANNSAGPDTITLAPSVTPYILPATQHITDSLTLNGGGSSTTTIRTAEAPAINGFRVTNGVQFVLNRVTLNSRVSGYGILADTGTTSVTVDDVVINIETANTTGIETRAGDFAATKLTVNGDLATAPCYNRGVALSLDAPLATATITDSTFNTCEGVFASGAAGVLDIRRSTIQYGAYGVYIRTDDEIEGYSIIANISSTLLYNDGNAPGYFSSSTAIEQYAVPDVNSDDVSITSNLRNVTIASPTGVRTGMHDNGITAQTGSCGGGGSAQIITNLNSSIVSGAFTDGYAIQKFASESCEENIANVERTSIDDTRDFPSNLLQTISNNIYGVQPGFVNGAGGDFHLAWNSPLIDYDTTSNFTPSESTTDLDGKPRRSENGIAGNALRRDLGAYEYNAAAPSVSIDALPSTVIAGSVVTLSASVADPNAGEAALLGYVWTLPGGTTSSASAPSLTAPATAGSYPIALTVTDATGRTGVAVETMLNVVVPPPSPVVGGVPPVAVQPTPDTTAPKAVFRKLSAKLSTLLAGKTATKFAFVLDEAGAAKASFQIKVTTTRLVNRKPVKVTKLVTFGAAALSGKVGANAISVKLTKAQQKLLIKTLRIKKAKFAYQLVVTVTDAAGNASVTTRAVAVKK